MSTLVENVQKVKNAHAALKTAIASKGVAVPEGAKLTDMPALVEQISTEPVPTNDRAVFAYDTATSLVVPKMLVVDFSSTTNLGNCFLGCYSLKSLALPAGFGQNAKRLNSCFLSCTSLKQLVLPAGFGQNATNLQMCFHQNTALTSLTLPAGFGQNATNLNNCFYKCSQLTDITGNPNFKVKVDFSYSPNLTHDSIMIVINGLQTVTSTQTLTLGSTNLAKLTEADKQIATNKGWTLA